MNAGNVKISIIGAGAVGSTTAFAIMNSGLASEIVIVDINKEKSLAETMDLSHGVSFVKPVEIISGDYADTKNSDIVIITAGVGRKPGQSRLDLINTNLQVFKSIVPEITKYCPNTIIIVVSNPVDILSYITYRLSGFPSSRVIGSGTVLDTSRFKYMLAKHFHIDSRNIHTYILGEHGDSEIAAWSLTSIAGMKVEQYCNHICKKCGGDFRLSIAEEVKNTSKGIIQGKGYTNYAIALSIRRIIEAILGDENSILTVSKMFTGQYGIKDVYMSIPSVIGRTGIIDSLSVPLNSSEEENLVKSAASLKDFISQLHI